MASSTLQAPVQGLNTSQNVFAQAPHGSLAVAENVVFTSANELEPVRGREAAAGFGDPGDVGAAIGFYGTQVLVHYGPSPGSAILLARGTATNDTTLTDLVGSFAPPPGNARMRFMGAARDCFFNTSTGVFMLSGDTEEPVRAGNSPGLLVRAECTGTSNWFEGSTAVAYRYTLCSLDAYNRVIEGAPSGRTILRNWIVAAIGGMVRAGTTVTVTTQAQLNNALNPGDIVELTPGEATFPAGLKTVVSATPTGFTYTEAGAAGASTVVQTFNIDLAALVTVYLPPAASEANFVRVYRSEMTLTPDGQPSDELFLAYESAFLEAADIALGRIFIGDTTPEGQLGLALYTNQNSGNGATGANYQPPICGDMAYFSNRAWFARTTQKQSLELQLIGVGSPDGIQVGDTITIGAETYTATATNTATLFEFEVFTGGSPQDNVFRTAQALIQSIIDSSAIIVGYYTSAENQPAGQMLLEVNTLGDAAFLVTSSRATCWNPQLPPAMGAYEVSSDNNQHDAGLYYSKLGLPEAVPPSNRLQVDADNDAILAIHPLNYRLYIYKTSGIYFVSDIEPYSVQKVSEAKLLAPCSVRVLDESLIALTDQGFLRIKDGVVAPFSMAIDDELNDRFGAALPNLATAAFAVSDEASRLYICWLPPVDSSITETTTAYVFNALSGGWTQLTYGVSAAAIYPPASQLYLSQVDSNDADDNYLLRQRNAFTSNDFQDESFTVTKLSQAYDSETDTTEVVLVDGSEVQVGDRLVGLALPNDSYLVSAVDGDTVTVEGQPPTLSVSSNAIRILTGIACVIRYNKLTAGKPADLKVFEQVTLLHKQNEAQLTEVDFTSEETTSDDVELAQAGWGDTPWGEAPWGSPAQQLRRIEPVPSSVANCCQLEVEIRIRQAQAGFKHLGLVAVIAPSSTTNFG